MGDERRASSGFGNVGSGQDPHDVQPALTRGVRLGPGTDALDEVAVLYQEWLVELHKGRDDVAGPIGDRHGVGLTMVVGIRRVDADVVHPDALVVRHVVIDGHLAFADHRHSPDLARVQPADMHECVGDGSLEVQAQISHVGMSVPHVPLSPHPGGPRYFVEQERCDRDVVRGKVPDDVAVTLVLAQ